MPDSSIEDLAERLGEALATNRTETGSRIEVIALICFGRMAQAEGELKVLRPGIDRLLERVRELEAREGKRGPDDDPANEMEV